MNLREAKERIKKLYEKRIPFILWGPTGVGKSSIIREVAQEMGVLCVSKSLLTLEPPDLEGWTVPDPSSGLVLQLPPEWAKYPDDAQGFLLFDELNHASNEMQKALYRVFYDRMIGDTPLPDGIVPCGTGNKREHGAVVGDLEVPLEARLHEINIEPDIQVWKAWALKNQIAPEIIAYLSAHPEDLYSLPDGRGEKVTCGRGWERVSNLLEQGMSTLEDLSGSIGGSIAAKFLAFTELRDKLPDIQKILKGDVSDIPDEFDVLTYTIQTLLSVISREKNPKLQISYSKAYFKYVRAIWEKGSDPAYGGFVEGAAAFLVDYKNAMPSEMFSKMLSDENFRELMKNIGREILPLLNGE